MLHIEVRKKIMEARERGLTIAEISRAYHVGENAIFRLLRQARETGDIRPKTHLRGRKPAMDEATLLEIKALIDSYPDITLAEIKEKLKLPVSVVSIHNAIHKKLGYEYKKRHYTRVNGNAQM